MEDEFTNLTLVDGEEEAFQEEEKDTGDEFQFYLVGSYLTDSVVHFQSLRNTLVDLWHPIAGIFIKDLVDKRILFQFFHEVDV